MGFIRSGTEGAPLRQPPPAIVRFTCSLEQPDSGPESSQQREAIGHFLAAASNILLLVERIGLGLLNANAEAVEPLIHAIEVFCIIVTQCWYILKVSYVLMRGCD